MDAVRNTLFALEFAWSIPVFSRMGCMEHQSGMSAVLRTVPDAMVRQASACLKAGTVISLITVCPVLARLLFGMDGAGFLSALVFALLVPSAAFCLGEWTASNRAFEILLLMLCFLALNVPSLLIAEHFSASFGTRMIAALLLTAGLPALSFGKRRIAQKAHA